MRPTCLVLIGQPRILREIVGELLSSEPDLEVMGQYADVAAFEDDCLRHGRFAAASRGRPIVAIAGDDGVLRLQRLAPVALSVRETSRSELLLTLERIVERP